MISGMASSGNFMYNSMLASALAQLLPSQERKVIRQWIDHLHKINDGEQMSNRNDYMWFLLLSLKNRRITKPFNTVPYKGDLVPLKELLKSPNKWKLLDAKNDDDPAIQSHIKNVSKSRARSASRATTR